MCSGPSRPPRLRPQGFSPSRRFPRKPGLRGLRPARLRAGLHAATVQDLVSPSGLHPQESRASLEAAGSLVVRSAPRSSATRRALISLDFPRRPRPSGPPSPEAPSVTSCVLECGRPRRGGRSPSRARMTFPPEPKLQTPRHPQARRTVLTLASLRRPRSVLPPACPTPFPGVATGSWVVALVGFFPSRALFRLRPRALTDLLGFSRSGGPGAHSRCATHGVAPRASGRPLRPCVLFWRPHDESTCRQRRRCVVYAGPPRGDRPLPPRP